MAATLLNKQREPWPHRPPRKVQMCPITLPVRLNSTRFDSVLFFRARSPNDWPWRVHRGKWVQQWIVYGNTRTVWYIHYGVGARHILWFEVGVQRIPVLPQKWNTIRPDCTCHLSDTNFTWQVIAVRHVANLCICILCLSYDGGSRALCMSHLHFQKR